MVMVLLLAMSVIVPDKTYAATSHSLKINNGGKTEHTFEIYQVSRVIYQERFFPISSGVAESRIHLRQD